MKTIEVLSKSGGFNKCIGGSFSFWQRGSSFTGLTGSASTKIADRFMANCNLATGVFDVNLSTDTPNYATANSVKFDVTTAQASIGAAEYAILFHRYEGNVIKELYGKPIVISFWVKSNLTGTYTVGVRNAPYYTRSFHTEYTINSPDTWEQKYMVVPHEYIGSWNEDINIGMDMLFSLASGSNYHNTKDQWNATDDFSTSNQVNLFASTSNYIQFAQIMAHEGRGLTDSFAYNGGNYVSEYEQCLRYFQTSGYYNVGHPLNTSQVHCQVNYRVAMRKIPTIVLNYTAANLNVIRSLNSGALLASSVAALSTPAGFGRIDSAGLYVTTYLYHFGYTADAEL